MKTTSEIRKAGIAARDALNKEYRTGQSATIVAQILQSEEYKAARTVMIYKAVRGEVRLEALERDPSAQGKCIVYPLCIGEGIMIALQPEGPDAWAKGSYGIPEPIREKSIEIDPADIDLVICPCTAFDEKCNRVGMGAGYYDRFLTKCGKARIISVAFEAQKADEIPVEPWDHAMEKTYTEKRVYLR